MTATWLAKAITNHVGSNAYDNQDDDGTEEFDKYSLEVIASYLEDHGYTVSFPD